MPNYKALYFKLFRAQNKAIKLLEQVGQEAEEQVLDSKDALDLLKVKQTETDSTGETEQ